MNQLIVKSLSEEDTFSLAKNLGAKIKGGEVFELLSDIGGGKTTFTRGLLIGIDNYKDVSSPSFNICNEYKTAKFNVYHFDFYRLNDPGIIKHELEEALSFPDNVIIIEWSDIVKDVLPKNRLRLSIKYIDEDKRELSFSYPDKYSYLF